MQPKMLFISWISYSRRSQQISEKFKMKLYLVQSLKRHLILAPLRYLLQTLRTIKILIKERPEVVFLQNPPILLPLIVYLYSRIRETKYIIDSHTFALLAWWWQWSLPLHAFLSRRAITTVVTNTHLEDMVTKWGANAFIIADIPSVFPEGKPYPVKGEFNLAVINIFAPDEPIEEVLTAAESLPDVRFYITGDTIRAKKSYLLNHPPNVVFTDFLPDDEYIGLLRSVHAILVLTTDDHTMQRGACEAVSIGKPIITSNWPLLKEYFNMGTIHVDNTARGIREGVQTMREQRQTLEKEVAILKQKRWEEWHEKQKLLLRVIENNLRRG